MPARRKPAPFEEASPPRSGLRLHAEGERLSALLKERDRLLSAIETKKRALERAQGKARDAHDEMAKKLGPLVTRYETVRAELRALFDELLKPGRLSASATKKVVKVRRALEAQGVWDEPGAAPPDTEGDDEQEPERAGRASSPPPGPSAFGPDSARREVRSAEQRGQDKDRESLRTVFRRLVGACHPDRATEDAERQTRTAIMKQATQAYEQGDLARLLQLEQAWQRRQALPSSESAEARCRELELVIRELSAQAKQLQLEVREAKRGSMSTPLGTPIDRAFAEAEQELEQLVVMREFVLSFRDGKISLSQFVAGPLLFQLEDDIDLEALLSEVLSEPSRKAARPARRKNEKRR